MGIPAKDFLQPISAPDSIKPLELPKKHKNFDAAKGVSTEDVVVEEKSVNADEVEEGFGDLILPFGFYFLVSSSNILHPLPSNKRIVPCSYFRVCFLIPSLFKFLQFLVHSIRIKV